MKYCINDNECKVTLNKDSRCHNCFLSSFPVECCEQIDVCDSTHIISKSENISSIFTL